MRVDVKRQDLGRGEKEDGVAKSEKKEGTREGGREGGREGEREGLDRSATNPHVMC